MNLTLKPERIEWPSMHYVFVEKVGPFQQTAQKAWQEFRAMQAEIAAHSEITGMVSLYKIEPQMVYRAGASVKEKPSQLPPGIKYEKFNGGAYYKFTLMGSYAQLPEACSRVFKAVEEQKLKIRPDYFIENYVNDPAKTPESELKTEILVSTF